MLNNFALVMKPLMEHEGGYSNEPSDPGGATFKGVTHKTYDSFRTAHGLTTQDVRRMTDAEKMQIYKENYWDEVKGDTLRSGLDYCMFDAAVNSGPVQAIKWLQRGLQDQNVYSGMIDGHAGTGTMAGARQADAQKLINNICDQRFAFMQTLKNWPNAKGGWTTRVKEVREISLRMSAVSDVAIVTTATIPTVTTIAADQSPKAYATEVKASETPQGKEGVRNIGLAGTGIITWLLSKSDAVTDNIGKLAGINPDTAKVLIGGIVLLALIALAGYGVYSITNVLARRAKGEQQEAN